MFYKKILWKSPHSHFPIDPLCLYHWDGFSQSLEEQDVKILWLWIFFIPTNKPHFQSPQYLNLWAQFQRKPVHRIHDKSKDKIFIYLKDHKKFFILNDNPDSRCETSENKQFVRFEKIIFMWKPLGEMSKLTPSFLSPAPYSCQTLPEFLVQNLFCYKF